MQEPVCKSCARRVEIVTLDIYGISIFYEVEITLKPRLVARCTNPCCNEMRVVPPDLPCGTKLRGVYYGRRKVILDDEPYVMVPLENKQLQENVAVNDNFPEITSTRHSRCHGPP